MRQPPNTGGGTAPGPGGTGGGAAPTQPTAGSALSSIAMFIAPLVGAVGLLATTGTIGRVQRDEPIGIAIAIGLVLVAGALWSLVPALEIEKAETKRGLRISSAVFALAGFVITLILVILIANDQPRPRITASLTEDRKALTATITASGLPTDQRAAVHVDALRRDPTGKEEFLAPERVYRAFVGPDNDGNVSHTLNIPLPRGDFTDVGVKAFTSKTSNLCDDYAPQELEGGEKTSGSGTACVTIALVPAEQATGGSAEQATGGS